MGMMLSDIAMKMCSTQVNCGYKASVSLCDLAVYCLIVKCS